MEAEIVVSRRVVAVWNVLQVRIVDDVRLLREANVIVIVAIEWRHLRTVLRHVRIGRKWRRRRTSRSLRLRSVSVVHVLRRLDDRRVWWLRLRGELVHVSRSFRSQVTLEINLRNLPSVPIKWQLMKPSNLNQSTEIFESGSLDEYSRIWVSAWISSNLVLWISILAAGSADLNNNKIMFY